jgi:hypothetical protein
MDRKNSSTNWGSECGELEAAPGLLQHAYWEGFALKTGTLRLKAY